MSRRKMLAADEELANEVAEYAKRRNVTLYQTVNEMLSQALKAEKIGCSLRVLVDQRQSLDDATRMSLGLTIDQVFNELLDLSCRFSPREVENLWRHTGKWYGKYFQLKKGDPLSHLTDALRYLTLGFGSDFLLEEEDSGILGS